MFLVDAFVYNKPLWCFWGGFGDA